MPSWVRACRMPSDAVDRPANGLPVSRIPIASQVDAAAPSRIAPRRARPAATAARPTESRATATPNRSPSSAFARRASRNSSSARSGSPRSSACSPRPGEAERLSEPLARLRGQGDGAPRRRRPPASPRSGQPQAHAEDGAGQQLARSVLGASGAAPRTVPTPHRLRRGRRPTQRSSPRRHAEQSLGPVVRDAGLRRCLRGPDPGRGEVVLQPAEPGEENHGERPLGGRRLHRWRGWSPASGGPPGPARRSPRRCPGPWRSGGRSRPGPTPTSATENSSAARMLACSRRARRKQLSPAGGPTHCTRNPAARSAYQSRCRPRHRSSCPRPSQLLPSELREGPGQGIPGLRRQAPPPPRRPTSRPART